MKKTKNMKKLILLFFVLLLFSCDKNDSSSNFITIEFAPTNENNVYLNEQLTIKVTYNISDDETERLGFRTSHIAKADNTKSNFIHTAKTLDKNSGSYEYKFIVFNLPEEPKEKFSYQVFLQKKVAENEFITLAESNIVRFNVLGMKK